METLEMLVFYVCFMHAFCIMRFTGNENWADVKTQRWLNVNLQCWTDIEFWLEMKFKLTSKSNVGLTSTSNTGQMLNFG